MKMSTENRCVMCGDIIPEGIQVCPLCAYEVMIEPNNKKKEETSATRIISKVSNVLDSIMRIWRERNESITAVKR